MIIFKVSTSGVLESVVSDSIEDTITIPEVVDGITVRDIDAFVFQGNTSITSVYIPKTVETLGYCCFSSCVSLETVVFEEGSALEKIKESCFYNCQNLINFKGTIKNLRYIGAKAFYNCKSLDSLDLRETLISGISESTFAGASIKNIQLPKTIEHIYSSAFRNADVDIDFNSMPILSIIGEKAFKCSNIKAVDFHANRSPSLVIKAEAFSNCNNLETVSLSENVVLDGGDTFTNCKNLKEVTIEMNSYYIPKCTFENCSNLSSVDILDSNIKYIGAQAFKNCSQLRSIAFPQSVKLVAKSAFANCNLSDAVDLTRVGSDFVLDNLCFYSTWVSLDSIKLDYLNPITIKGNPFFSAACTLEMFTQAYPFAIICE